MGDGTPPYPLVKDLQSDELDYLFMWIDERMFGIDNDGNIFECPELSDISKSGNSNGKRGQLLSPEKAQKPLNSCFIFNSNNN